MLKRTPKDPTTEDAPAGIAPWEMLDEAGIAAYTAQVRERDPLRNLTAFARRLDQDTIACFDKGADGKSKAVAVLRLGDDSAPPKEHRYPGFSAWFDDVLAAAAIWNTEGPMTKAAGRLPCGPFSSLYWRKRTQASLWARSVFSQPNSGWPKWPFLAVWE